MTAPEQGQPGNGQVTVLAFLGRKDPKYKRIDTHASIIFLGEDRVLKVKRAVRLPFLDFSTLEQRKRACNEELTVNRRFAPDLYRRIVPIAKEKRASKLMATAQ